MSQKERPILHVEGKDDYHAIGHLLSRHDIEPSVVKIKPLKGEDEDTGGKDQLLKGMGPGIKVANRKPIGFVLDADEASKNRWHSVRGRLKGIGLTLPNRIPEEGFVGYTDLFKARVGVWLMPDNRRPGAIEEFLKDLIADGDTLIQLAETSTDSAKGLGAAFPNTHRTKAVLHTWLAWQERPGVPYGTAIGAHYFQHDTSVARAFVDWFKRVFEAPMPDP